MNEHPSDNATSRFQAFWLALFAFASFGVAFAVVAGIGSLFQEDMPEVDQKAVDTRMAVRQEVVAAQTPLVDEAAFVDQEKGIVRLPVDDAKKLVLAQLKEKKPAATKTVVPGSPTALEQSEAAPAPTPAPAGAAPAEPAKPEGEDPKPAEEKPEGQPEAAPAPAPAPAEAAPAEPAKPEGENPKPAGEKPEAAPAPKPDKTQASN